MKAVQLHGEKAAGRVALVDDQDYELVSRYRWYVWEIPATAESRGAGPYAMANVRRDGRHATVKMHVLLTGYSRADHRDGNGLNNQRSNLREASAAENAANQGKRPGCSSQFKGVCWYPKLGRWLAQFRADGRRQHLGYFDDEEDAARAYDTAALARWGDFARLNFPHSGENSTRNGEAA